MTSLQRIFTPGDQWMYFKIYTGFKTADHLITGIISPLVDHLLGNHIITKWFFIRYFDTGLHLRLRFLIADTSKSYILIRLFNEALQEYIQYDLVWRVQIDTYQREIERYGVATMELSESLFFYDSQYFTEILRIIQVGDTETLRWLSVMASIDYLLNDFSFNLQQKITFISMVKENFSREFGLENSRTQLSYKYRAHRKEVEGLLDAKEEKYHTIHHILESRSKLQRPVVYNILQYTENSEKLNNLLSSYTHMMINRWFCSNQRKYEAVVYDFLLKYFKSKAVFDHKEKTNDTP